MEYENQIRSLSFLCCHQKLLPLVGGPLAAIKFEKTDRNVPLQG